MNKIKLSLLVFSFAGLLHAQDSKEIINRYFKSQNLSSLRAQENFVIENEDFSTSLNGNVVKLQQTINGIPLFNGVATALIKEGNVSYFTDNFNKNFNKIGDASVLTSKKDAFLKAAKDLQIINTNYTIIGFLDKNDHHALEAKHRLVYFNQNGDLRLAHEFTFPEKKSPNYWDVLVDDKTGEILLKNNLNISCSFNEGAFSRENHFDKLLSNNQANQNWITTEQIIKEQKTTGNSNLNLVADNASYNVYALPIESPIHGSRSIQTNPWIITSSPEGWHFDGTTHYTTTQGNNVNAYQDVYEIDFAGIGPIPDGGATRNFNFPQNLSTNPLTDNNVLSAITNLFYVNNRVHDIFYRFGFTETARNFQNTNFGLGGAGGDYVLAEAQDGAATDTAFNNANFATPPDGTSGRMQMYLWILDDQKLFYNAPTAAIPRTPLTNGAGFGTQLTAIPVTGDVKLSPVLDACTALPANSLSGFIGLAERGTCAFVDKVQNMQNAGAIGAIIYNNVGAANFPTMGGTSTTITIPSIIIENTEGEYIKSLLAANTVVNISLNLHVERDGSLDNGVMTHEYGHGISNRLTGNGYSCLSTSGSTEQMGEGWSDFFALMLTNQPGDNASVARGIGTYVIGEPITGLGIRPAKYSPDFAVNNYTYGNTNTMNYTNSSGVLVPSVHSIGFVWASILWDLHWKYVEAYGYASDVVANPNSGSAKVLQLVVNGIKLQECSPTFVSGRNAILSADQASTGGANRCMIWRTFAKRGVGVNASAGSKTSFTDQVEDFTVPADCVLATEEANVNSGFSIYPNPAKNEFSIKFPTRVLGKVKVEVYDVSGKLVLTEDNVTPKEVKSFDVSSLVNGVYLVKVNGLGLEQTKKLIIKK